MNTKQLAQDFTDNLNRNVTDGGGIDSLLNESKYQFKVGQTVKYKDRDTGETKKGTYRLASSFSDHVVLMTKNGFTRVVHTSDILK